jgi:hypothetical protein
MGTNGHETREGSRTPAAQTGRNDCRNRKGDEKVDSQHPQIPQRSGDEEYGIEAGIRQKRFRRTHVQDREIAKSPPTKSCPESGGFFLQVRYNQPVSEVDAIPTSAFSACAKYGFQDDTVFE